MQEINRRQSEAAQDIDNALDYQETWSLFGQELWPQFLGRYDDTGTYFKEFGMVELAITRLVPKPDRNGTVMPDAKVAMIRVDGRYASAALMAGDDIWHPGQSTLTAKEFAEAYQLLKARWN